MMGSSSQGVVEIIEQIVRILDADREAQEVGRRGRAGPLDRGAMLDQALDTAERGRAFPDANLCGGGDRGLLAALDPDREHATETALHLARRDGMTRVLGQTRIQDRRDARVCYQS